MTHQLHPTQVDLLRKLNKTAIVFMLLFLLNRPVGESEMASLLAISPKTIRAHLKSLARLGVVTRTHRYNGWILTAGGRQMLLGQSTGERAAERMRGIHVPELPREKSNTSAENCRSNGKIYRSSGKIYRSLPVAAASLSFKEESNAAAAAKAGASGKKYRSNGKISRSGLRPRIRKAKIEDRTGNGNGQTDRMVQANLQAFASIGLMQNDFVSRICQMNHVTPAYIFGQKKRLEAERRYSAGLLLKVIQCKDSLPEKYSTCDSSPPLPRGVATENVAQGTSSPPLSRGVGGDSTPPLSRGAAAETVAQRDSSPPLSSGAVSSPPFPRGAGEESSLEPDPSIHEPLSSSGITAAKAWSAVLQELQTDMPKAAYDKWVRDTVLISARDGTFLIGAQNGYAREWLESRMTSTITRLLAGICNRSVEVRFIDSLETATWSSRSALRAISPVKRWMRR